LENFVSKENELEKKLSEESARKFFVQIERKNRKGLQKKRSYRERAQIRLSRLFLSVFLFNRLFG